jgi:hypothetical protein
VAEGVAIPCWNEPEVGLKHWTSSSSVGEASGKSGQWLGRYTRWELAPKFLAYLPAGMVSQHRQA